MIVLDASATIELLLASPAVEFASPLFRTRDAEWVLVTPDVLVRVHEDHRAGAVGLLGTLAPEMKIEIEATAVKD